MKKTQFWVLLLIGLFLLTACSEKDDDTTPVTANPPAMSSLPVQVYTMPAESTAFDPGLLVDVQYNNATEQAVSLTHFITKAMTDLLEGASSSDTTETQNLFSYHLIASDGFTPRDRSYADLTWEQFKTGYLLPNNSFRSYFPSDAIQTAFDVKHLQTIKIYRSVVVVKPNNENVLWEMSTLDSTTVNNYDGNPETAYSLKDMISTYITDNPAGYKYIFTANDGYQVEYTWQEMQDCKWLKNTKRTIFPNYQDMPNSRKKFKKLWKITLLPV